MDIEQMKKDLGGGNVFPIGEENVAFAKYFTGECYLNMLTTESTCWSGYFRSKNNQCIPHPSQGWSDPYGYWWKRMVSGRRKTGP